MENGEETGEDELEEGEIIDVVEEGEVPDDAELETPAPPVVDNALDKAENMPEMQETFEDLLDQFSTLTQQLRELNRQQAEKELEESGVASRRLLDDETDEETQEMNLRLAALESALRRSPTSTPAPPRNVSSRRTSRQTMSDDRRPSRRSPLPPSRARSDSRRRLSVSSSKASPFGVNRRSDRRLQELRKARRRILAMRDPQQQVAEFLKMIDDPVAAAAPSAVNGVGHAINGVSSPSSNGESADTLASSVEAPSSMMSRTESAPVLLSTDDDDEEVRTLRELVLSSRQLRKAANTPPVAPSPPVEATVEKPVFVDDFVVSPPVAARPNVIFVKPLPPPPAPPVLNDALWRKRLPPPPPPPLYGSASSHRQPLLRVVRPIVIALDSDDDDGDDATGPPPQKLRRTVEAPIGVDVLVGDYLRKARSAIEAKQQVQTPTAASTRELFLERMRSCEADLAKHKQSVAEDTKRLRSLQSVAQARQAELAKSETTIARLRRELAAAEAVATTQRKFVTKLEREERSVQERLRQNVDRQAAYERDWKEIQALLRSHVQAASAATSRGVDPKRQSDASRLAAVEREACLELLRDLSAKVGIGAGSFSVPCDLRGGSLASPAAACSSLFPGVQLVQRRRQAAPSALAVTLVEPQLAIGGVLGCFRSFRLCPCFPSLVKHTPLSLTNTNNLNPFVPLCPFDLSGTCKDAACKWQHFSSIVPTSGEAVDALFAYFPAGLLNEERCNLRSVILREAPRRVDAHAFATPAWQSVFLALCHAAGDPDSIDFIALAERRSSMLSTSRPREISITPASSNTSDTTVEPNPFSTRYFDAFADSAVSDPLRVLHDAELALRKDERWNSRLIHVPQALNVICAGLAEHPESVELWLRFADLYTQQKSDGSLAEILREAVDFAPSFELFWRLVRVERSWSAKVNACYRFVESENLKCSAETLQFVLYAAYVVDCAGEDAEPVFERVLAIGAVESLELRERCLYWLCRIYYALAGTFPTRMFVNVSESGDKDVLLVKEAPSFDWSLARSVSDERREAIANLFEVALCSIDSTQLPEQLDAFPLFREFVRFELALGRQAMAEHLCASVREACAQCDEFWLLYSDVRLSTPSEGVSTFRSLCEFFNTFPAARACPRLQYAKARLSLSLSKYDVSMARDELLVDLCGRFYEIGDGGVGDVTMLQLCKSILMESDDEFSIECMSFPRKGDVLPNELPSVWLCYWFLAQSCDDNLAQLKRALDGCSKFDAATRAWLVSEY